MNYTQSKKNIDYFVKTSNELYGMVKYYIEFNDKLYFILKEFKKNEMWNHFIKLFDSVTQFILPAEKIEEKLIYSECNDEKYAVPEPNKYERNL